MRKSGTVGQPVVEWFGAVYPTGEYAMSTTTSNHEAAIFGRLLQAEKGDLPPELARYVLEIGFAQEDHDRMNQLAAKARVAALAAEEQRELENYNLVGDVLALWHSKARRSLQRSQSVS